MTPLGVRLVRRIAAAGPMTVAEYMAECLLAPEHGYYATRDPLGAAGDFTTAPEISQMFGELLGLALAQTWREQGAPAPAVLAELGPGRGTLMADLLRAARALPGFFDALQVHLVETSPTLRARQAEAVPTATWHDSADDLPDGPLYLIANEFLDALPIRQFVREGDGWRERVVGLEGAALAFGLTEVAPVASLSHRLGDTREGEMVETCAPAAAVAEAVAARIARHGGAALFIDYGGWRSRGDTLQALRRHRPEHPLAHPGEADLTAHVDFEPLVRAARRAGAAASGPVPQGVLLERLGITPRAQALARNLAGSALENHVAAHRRLTHPDEMGSLFRALALHPADCPPPPGFLA